MPGWSFAAVWSAIAQVVPDREAIVCGERRISWSAFDERAGQLGQWRHETGSGGVATRSRPPRLAS